MRRVPDSALSVGAYLAKTEGKTTVPFCDYFTCRNSCSRIFGTEGEKPSIWDNGTELSYTNRFQAIILSSVPASHGIIRSMPFPASHGMIQFWKIADPSKTK